MERTSRTLPTHRPGNGCASKGLDLRRQRAGRPNAQTPPMPPRSRRIRVMIPRIGPIPEAGSPPRARRAVATRPAESSASSGSRAGRGVLLSVRVQSSRETCDLVPDPYRAGRARTTCLEA
jgi:hypothetical protein